MATVGTDAAQSAIKTVERVSVNPAVSEAVQVTASVAAGITAVETVSVSSAVTGAVEVTAVAQSVITAIETVGSVVGSETVL